MKLTNKLKSKPKQFNIIKLFYTHAYLVFFCVLVVTTTNNKIIAFIGILHTEHNSSAPIRCMSCILCDYCVLSRLSIYTVWCGNTKYTESKKKKRTSWTSTTPSSARWNSTWMFVKTRSTIIIISNGFTTQPHIRRTLCQQFNHHMFVLHPWALPGANLQTALSNICSGVNIKFHIIMGLGFKSVIYIYIYIHVHIYHGAFIFQRC